MPKVMSIIPKSMPTKEIAYKEADSSQRATINIADIGTNISKPNHVGFTGAFANLFLFAHTMYKTIKGINGP